jgi:hypothetical protein
MVDGLEDSVLPGPESKKPACQYPGPGPDPGGQEPGQSPAPSYGLICPGRLASLAGTAQLGVSSGNRSLL